MFTFTKQERLVLICLAIVMSTGLSLDFISKKYPQLSDAVNFVNSSSLTQHKIDLNTASEEELVSIPYIGVYTARRIIEFREQNSRFVSLEQLKAIKGIREKNYARFKPYLKVSISK